jgi:hypothetical protein
MLSLLERSSSRPEVTKVIETVNKKVTKVTKKVAKHVCLFNKTNNISII